MFSNFLLAVTACMANMRLDILVLIFCVLVNLGLCQVCATGSCVGLVKVAWMSTVTVTDSEVSTGGRPRTLHNYSALNSEGTTEMPTKSDKSEKGDKPVVAGKGDKPGVKVHETVDSDPDSETEALEVEAALLRKELARAEKRREVEELKARLAAVNVSKIAVPTVSDGAAITGSGVTVSHGAGVPGSGVTVEPLLGVSGSLPVPPCFKVPSPPKSASVS